MKSQYSSPIKTKIRKIKIRFEMLNLVKKSLIY